MASSKSDGKGNSPTQGMNITEEEDFIKMLLGWPENVLTQTWKIDKKILMGAAQKKDTKAIKNFATTIVINSVDKHGHQLLSPEEIKKAWKLSYKEKVPRDFKIPVPVEVGSTAVDAGPAKQIDHSADVRTGSAKVPPDTSSTENDQLPSHSSETERSGKDTVMKQQKSAGCPEKGQTLKMGHGNSLSNATKNTSKQQTDNKTLLEKREEELKEHDEELKVRDEEIEELTNKLQIRGQQLDKAEGNLKRVKAEKDAVFKERQSIITKQEKDLERIYSENFQLQADLKKITEERDKAVKGLKDYQLQLEKAYKDNEKNIRIIEDKHDSEIRAKNSQLETVLKEREDLKTRFSKLAGEKLTDQNADIADLSDPNRAMKVSEKFGQLYDDEWTDAFEALKKKKIPAKEAIQCLLRILQDCLVFTNNLKDTQMLILNNVLLHPSQDVTKFASEPRKNISGMKEKARISSKDEKVVRSVRKLIGVSETCLNEVKQVFIMETKSWDQQGYDKKQLEQCTPYLQKCAEICWLMVIHDPPMYMKFDAKRGDKLDPNLYTVYSSSGDRIDYLVWPPLFNEDGGGLITKGVAEPQKVVKKK